MVKRPAARRRLDHLRKLANRNLASGTDVHEVRRIVHLQEKEARGRKVVDVEELAQGRARTP